MDIVVHAKPLYSFKLKREVLNLLVKLSKLHYDFKCKCASMEADSSKGIKNGFLTIWGFRFTHIHDDLTTEHLQEAEITTGSDELQIVLKICEPINWVGVIDSIYNKIVINNLTEDIKKAIDLAQKTVPSWHVLHKSDAEIENE